jgi:hypothetical protein
MVFIYLLRLSQNKFYVGKTKNLTLRIKDHIESKGSMWTKKYKYIKTDKIFTKCSKFDEDKITIKYMEKYGIDNVRGGIYSQIVLSNDYLKHINKIINHANDNCIRCGSSKHFIMNCNQVTHLKCCRCGNSGHTSNKCTSDKNIYGFLLKKEYFCFRCGRSCHSIRECAYQYDNYGNSL